MASVRQLTKPNREGKRPWVVTYTDQEGKRRQVTPKSGLKSDADKIRKQVEKTGSASQYVALTVEAACEIYIRRREADIKSGERSLAHHKREISIYERYIRPSIGRKKLGQMSPLDVQQWVDNIVKVGRESGASIKSCNYAVNFLSAVFLEAQRLGYISKNTIKDVPPRMPRIKQSDPIEVPNKDEAQSIIDNSKGQFSLVVRLAIQTGMRAGEICALKWSNIDFDARIIRVRASLEAKTKLVKAPKTRAGNRDIPLTPQLADDLLQHRDIQKLLRAKALRNTPAIFVFSGPRGNPLDWGTTYRDHWKPLLVECGFADEEGNPRFRFHSLRHFAASLLIEAELPPKRIQYILGHTSIQMTFDRYGRLFDDKGAASSAMAAIERRLHQGSEA